MRISIASGWFFPAAASLILICFAVYVRRNKALSPTVRRLRLTAACLAAVLILRPGVIFYRSTPEKPKVAVLIDGSVHMQDGPPSKDAHGSKYTSVMGWLSKNKADIYSAADMECYSYSEGLYKVDCSTALPRSAAAGYYDSDLPAALRAFSVSVGEQCPDSIWIFSDGLSSTPGAATISRPCGGTPRMEIVLAGDATANPGAEISDLQGPAFAFAHIPFTLSARIRTSGLKGVGLELALRDPSGVETAKRYIHVPEEGGVLVSSFTLSSPDVGYKTFSVCLRRNGGSCMDTAERSVSVVREKLRVMYLAGRPSFEYAYLREFLKNQQAIDLVSFVILRNPEDMPNAAENELSLIPFPVRDIFLRDIGHFDVFLAQDFDFKRFAIDGTYIASLEQFVRNGGGLAVIGGKSAFGGAGYAQFDLLRGMLPVEISGEDDYVPSFSASVRPAPHPASQMAMLFSKTAGLSRELPPVTGINLFGPLKPGARPIFLCDYPSDPNGIFAAEKVYGRGRVIAVSGDSTWRWKIGAGADTRYSGLYNAFWTGIMAYLDGTVDLKKVALEDSRAKSGLARVFRLRVLDENYLPSSDVDKVYVEAALEFEGRTSPVDFEKVGKGLYEARVVPVGNGKHILRVSARNARGPLGMDSVAFRAGSSMQDFVPSDEPAISATAKALGGAYHRMEELKSAKALLDALPVSKNIEREAFRFDADASVTVMVLLVLSFCAAWAAGRLHGLP